MADSLFFTQILKYTTYIVGTYNFVCLYTPRSAIVYLLYFTVDQCKNNEMCYVWDKYIGEVVLFRIRSEQCQN